MPRKKTPSSNGKSYPQLDPGFHPTHGVFVTKSGFYLELTSKINQAYLMELLYTQKGKPKPPKVPVNRAGVTVREENPGDPDYLSSVAEWEQLKQLKFARWLFGTGVTTSPPEEYTLKVLEDFEDATETFVRYLWIIEVLEGGLSQDENSESSLLTQAIIGIALPTEGGVAEVAEKFPDKSEQQTD